MIKADEKSNGASSGESGNVLFLILIAVALFAALSYAVTRSTRSGSQDASSETSLINSSSLTQYPAGIRTSLVRMIISNNASIDDLAFDTPSDFGSLSNTNFSVFHPAGGGATYQLAAADAMAATAEGPWHFNANFEIPEIGTGGAGGNDLIAFLPGVTQGLCKKLNEEYGITPGGAVTFSGIPNLNIATDADIDDDKLEGETVPTTDRADINNGDDDFLGQPFGCFYDSTRSANNRFVYYHVLLER